MLRALQVCGLPVVDSGVARQAGVVADVVIEPSTGRIASIDLRHGDGWLGDRVPADFIVRLGPDRVLVTRSRELELAPPDDTDDQRIRARQLIGGEVLTESGQRLGTIADILLEEDTMAVAGYELSGLPLPRRLGRGRIQPNEVVSCSNELMVVRDRPSQARAAPRQATSSEAAS